MAKAIDKKKAEAPSFSFAKFSLLDQLRVNEIQAELMDIQQAGAALQALAAEDPEAEVPDGLVARMQQVASIQREQLTMIAGCLRGVPAAWLVDDAPDDIEWGTLEALRFVRSDKMGAIQAAFREAVTANFLASNSP